MLFSLRLCSSLFSRQLLCCSKINCTWHLIQIFLILHLWPLERESTVWICMTVMFCTAPGLPAQNGHVVRREDSRGSLFMDPGTPDSIEVRTFHRRTWLCLHTVRKWFQYLHEKAEVTIRLCHCYFPNKFFFSFFPPQFQTIIRRTGCVLLLKTKQNKCCLKQNQGLISLHIKYYLRKKRWTTV